MATTEEPRGDLPEDRCLAEVAAAMEEAGHFAEVVDAEWRSVYLTKALRAAGGFLVDTEADLAASGGFAFGREELELFASTPSGSIALDYARTHLQHVGEWVVHDLGRDQLSALIDPRLDGVLDLITDTGRTSAITYSYDGYGPAGTRPRMMVTATRIRRPDGELAGTLFIHKPALSMMTLAMLGATGDPGHLERQQQVAAAGRRPGAILFADLEGSAPLAKRLSTSSYFALSRRVTRSADQIIVEAGGITGRHSGDGVVAFFLVENLGSESAAARACAQAARALRSVMPTIAERSGLQPGELTLRFGLHWGSTLYVGLISTLGRTEVTALGDDVNDAARIEPCATGGRILASKALVERLTVSDSDAIGLDLDRITYIQLGDLSAATEKARRDAPSLAVCEL